jgi:hypothetical protein
MRVWFLGIGMEGDGDLRGGAQSPAVIDGFDDCFHLVLGWAIWGHDLHEGKEEGAVFVGGPLGCHGWGE